MEAGKYQGMCVHVGEGPYGAATPGVSVGIVRQKYLTHRVQFVKILWLPGSHHDRFYTKMEEHVTRGKSRLDP